VHGTLLVIVEIEWEIITMLIANLVVVPTLSAGGKGKGLVTLAQVVPRHYYAITSVITNTCASALHFHCTHHDSFRLVILLGMELIGNQQYL
jgi:hypothetical protein